jgi:hypothetical protein
MKLFSKSFQSLALRVYWFHRWRRRHTGCLEHFAGYPMMPMPTSTEASAISKQANPKKPHPILARPGTWARRNHLAINGKRSVFNMSEKTNQLKQPARSDNAGAYQL